MNWYEIKKDTFINIDKCNTIYFNNEVGSIFITNEKGMSEYCYSTIKSYNAAVKKLKEKIICKDIFNKD